MVDIAREAGQVGELVDELPVALEVHHIPAPPLRPPSLRRATRSHQASQLPGDAQLHLARTYSTLESISSKGRLAVILKRGAVQSPAGRECSAVKLL